MSEKEKNPIKRYQGCIVGGAVGDALGAPAEFLSPEQIANQYGDINEMLGGGFLNWRIGQTTDDTDLTLCVVDSLIEQPQYNPSDIADRMYKWYLSDPVDIGGTTAASLDYYSRGYQWNEAGKMALVNGRGGPGNGSLMRTAPVGLYFRKRPPYIDQVAREISSITHAHPDCVITCQMVSHMIALLAEGLDKDMMISSLKQKYNFLSKHRQLLMSVLNDEVPSSGNNAQVKDTFSVAFNAFIKADSFEDSVKNAIKKGWDTDTQATIAGSLAGTYWGIDAIPLRWKDKINPTSSDALGKKAIELYRLSELV